ncbi:MAG: hypothetical protein ABI134_00115, partial [Byssovorax sp.]
MPARRSGSRNLGVRVAALAALAALVATASACGQRRSPGPSADASASSSTGASSSANAVTTGSATLLLREPALVTLARSSTADAAVAARTLRAKLDAHAGDTGAAYLVLRRALALASPFLRARESMANEVIFGPRRSMIEAGGARLLLDGALALGDAAEASRQVQQIERGLQLAGAELERARIPVEAGAGALSDAAYDLGAVVLEATADLPAEPAAIFADARGTLDAVVGGAEAIAHQLAVTGDELAALSAAAA